MLLSRVIEVVMCIPALVLILALSPFSNDPTIWHMMAVLGATSWTGIARLTRGEFIRLRNADFVTAARAIGVGRAGSCFVTSFATRWRRCWCRSPSASPPQFSSKARLSFLGFGAPPPNPSWGSLLNDGRTNQQMWWLIVFPGVAIFLTVLAYNLIGEGLQEATDPRLKQSS